jgi:hypothetical protein
MQRIEDLNIFIFIMFCYFLLKRCSFRMLKMCKGDCSPMKCLKLADRTRVFKRFAHFCSTVDHLILTH